MTNMAESSKNNKPKLAVNPPATELVFNYYLLTVFHFLIDMKPTTLISPCHTISGIMYGIK